MKKKLLAQLNISRMISANIQDPLMADFVAQLDRINQLAESSKGFVWRLKDEGGNATSIQPFDDERIIVNMSVWESMDDLMEYVFKSAHSAVMRDRNKWFEKFGKASTVFWYIDEGHTPSLEEAKERLEYLQKNGASEYAFDFKNKY
ncbi:DUF3291 domain-containing protein [Arcicella rigui]|uniref:DUF3291 domain-containing protein n=1 Tax=Arcicella rigui TaxID=797020 RepID=A0ABU5Q401_9BACT|nr:DUF3291 domain-containing protein [Arcicella rigui]MEA5137554.1 DUF3291 domain-containing protein [Arcicella rigui]